MTSVSDIVSLVNPSDGTTGVSLNSSISVLFTTEIDPWSIEHGGFVLEGQDTDLVIYPGYTPTTLVAGEESEILQSPGLKGIVPGTFLFQRIDLTTTSEVHTEDTTGAGNLFRTKVLFKPSYPLKPQTEYTVYLVGDDDTTDSEIFGLRSRSIFDVVEDPSNTGDGAVTFSGVYTGGLTTDTLNLRITTAGTVGVAKFEAWRNSSPLDLSGPYLTSLSELNLFDGVTVQFLEGDFDVGDEFSVVVKRPTIYTDTVVYSFVTGNGSITTVPTTTSTSVTGDPIVSVSTEFSIIETTPTDRSVNLSVQDASRIIVEFSAAVDSSTVNSSTVQVNVEPVIDHPLLSSQIPTGPIAHTTTVSGNFLIIDL